jgi:hypothetical protein
MFDETVDTHFEGPVAEDAKKRALAMADMFRSRLARINSEGIKPLF